MYLLQKAGFAFVVAGAIAVAALMCQTNDAEARPAYKKAFEAKYGDSIKKVDCTVCHPNPKTKKDRNQYAKDFQKVLATKDCKDEDKINAALEKIETKESQSEGKTYGELIKAGKRPGGDKPGDKADDKAE